MSKLYFIPFLFFFYLALLPNTTWACGSNTTQQNCCNEAAQNCSDKNDDCCQNTEANLSENEDKGCSGNCDNSSCHCTTIGISLFSPATMDELKLIGFLSYNEQQKITDYNNYLSSGFISIWLPPKIG